MGRTISIGKQRFEDLRTNDNFYVDKTGFIRDWWQSDDDVTLICRPRRFGKTLNLDTVRCFLSTEYAGRGDELFGGLEVWRDPTMRALQGTVPVVFLSFARVKERTLASSLTSMKRILRMAVSNHSYLMESDSVSAATRVFLSSVSDNMDDSTAADTINQLCSALQAHWGVRPVVLLDEYDTPMQEAWLGGYWDDMAAFQRSLFNATFKTNPALGRALITGITRVSRESIFSDLNNLEICSMRVSKYETSFGFTEREVVAGLEEYGLVDQLENVKRWYDGFTIGNASDIYNPWSMTKFFSSAQYDTYWANTSGNGLVSSIVRQSDDVLKTDFERLLQRETIRKRVDEQVVFSELEYRTDAVWGLLVAAGYVKALAPVPEYVRDPRTLEITNYETLLAFDDMVAQWFARGGRAYGEFPRALFAGDTRMATRFLSDVCRACMSSFDGGTHASAESQPERFYHGLVLGLLVELRGRYTVESNRESGYGRYDVMLVPTDGAAGTDPAVVMEFKVFDDYDEQTLADTVARAREQIEEKAYVTTLTERGIAAERIRTYGIAFRGKEVLVG